MPDTVDTSNITIDSTFSMAASQTPSEDHSLFAFKVGTDGKPVKGSQGWYTIKLLIQTLGKVATDAEAGAVEQMPRQALWKQRPPSNRCSQLSLKP